MTFTFLIPKGTPCLSEDIDIIEGNIVSEVLLDNALSLHNVCLYHAECTEVSFTFITGAASKISVLKKHVQVYDEAKNEVSYLVCPICLASGFEIQPVKDFPCPGCKNKGYWTKNDLETLTEI